MSRILCQKAAPHDDQGFCLFTKRLTDGCFAWPTTKEQVCRSPRRSFHCFWRGSIGAGRARPIDRVWPADFVDFALILLP
ncbi:IS66 family insertion sequence element accessory protein TnpB [Mesorhizobium sp. M1121]|uniref:IS66 family insertion sequence element accessory protein TnpB n=1 Tax=Mesorhizobium sp. M1121 TaxID=2957058 RepID=UPI0033377637